MRTPRRAPLCRRAHAPRFHLRLEHLESRVTPCNALSHILGTAPDHLSGGHGDFVPDFHPTIVAGDPNGLPPDSPSNRVDANTDLTIYDGVGSVQVNTRRGTYIGTATPISGRHILTAGHVVDINSDGRVDNRDGIRSIYFILNYGGNQTHKIPVSRIDVSPEFTGFARPSVNDDLAVLTLGSDLPAGVPIYALPNTDLAPGTPITLVGYGQSGDGVSGYYVNASFTVKRVGQNTADVFYTEDDAGQSPANEVFRFDFDAPNGTNGTFGGPSLGNTLETTLGGGDSGGPSFVGATVVGVNTFTQGFTAPRFGSLGGGINVFPYLAFINSVLSRPVSGTVSSGTGSKGGGSGAPVSKLLSHGGGSDTAHQHMPAWSATSLAILFPDAKAVGAGSTPSASLPAAFTATAREFVAQPTNARAAAVSLVVGPAGGSGLPFEILYRGPKPNESPAEVESDEVPPAVAEPERGMPPAADAPAVPNSADDAEAVWSQGDPPWVAITTDAAAQFPLCEWGAAPLSSQDAESAPTGVPDSAAIGLAAVLALYSRPCASAKEQERRRRRWMCQ